MKFRLIRSLVSTPSATLPASCLAPYLADQLPPAKCRPMPPMPGPTGRLTLESEVNTAAQGWRRLMPREMTAAISAISSATTVRKARRARTAAPAPSSLATRVEAAPGRRTHVIVTGVLLQAQLSAFYQPGECEV